MSFSEKIELHPKEYIAILGQSGDKADSIHIALWGAPDSPRHYDALGATNNESLSSLPDP